jgi:hypothetical protein
MRVRRARWISAFDLSQFDRAQADACELVDSGEFALLRGLRAVPGPPRRAARPRSLGHRRRACGHSLPLHRRILLLLGLTEEQGNGGPLLSVAARSIVP